MVSLRLSWNAGIPTSEDSNARLATGAAGRVGQSVL
jgi:hypothetical protein